MEKIMKNYLAGTISLLVVLVWASFAQGVQVPTMESIAKGGDTTPPLVTITSPKDGSTVSGLLTVSATASDDVAVTKVGFCVSFPDGDYYCVPGGDTSAPYEVSMDSRDFPNGLNEITVYAYDAANNRAAKRLTVLINNIEEPVDDTTPPVVTITSPKDGSTVSGLFTISATASDNDAVTKVGFCVSFPDGDYYCAPGGDTSAPYEVSMDSRDFPNGLNEITVYAYDAANNRAAKRLTVLIDNEGDTDPIPDPETVKNIYLDNGGSGDGSIGNPYGKFSEIPWSSIQSWVDSGYAVNINLKRGVTWTGQALNVTASGTASNRITIQPYGSGADPIIDGTGSGVDVTVRLDQRSYVTLDGLELRNGNVRNLSFYGPGVGNILQNCNYHSSPKSVFVYNQTGLIIQNNSIHDLNGHGIYLTGGSSQTDIKVQYNHIYNLGLHGIHINANGAGYIKDSIIRYNKIHDVSSGVNEGGGLRSQIYGNLFYDLSARGIVFFVDQNPAQPNQFYTAKDASVYNNTFYMPGGGECIKVNYKSNGHTLKNNIFYKGSDYDPCINVVSSSENLAASDHNLFYRTSGTFAIYQGISYSNLTNWQNGTPFGYNSHNSNPGFTNAGSDDFTLTSGSPAQTGAEEEYFNRLGPNSSWPDNVILMTDPDSIGAYGY